MRTINDYQSRKMYFTNNFNFAIKLQRENRDLIAYDFNSGFKNVPIYLNFDYVVCTHDDYILLLENLESV